MDATLFFDRVEQDERLSGLGVVKADEPQKDHIVIEDSRTGYRTQLPVSAVMQHDWPTLRSVILGEREPNVLNHMTRIVGYYSRIENWNKSKIGELQDRKAGSYILADGK